MFATSGPDVVSSASLSNPFAFVRILLRSAQDATSTICSRPSHRSTSAHAADPSSRHARRITGRTNDGAETVRSTHQSARRRWTRRKRATHTGHGSTRQKQAATHRSTTRSTRGMCIRSSRLASGTDEVERWIFVMKYRSTSLHVAAHARMCSARGNGE
jgi:hypothetical protein